MSGVLVYWVCGALLTYAAWDVLMSCYGFFMPKDWSRKWRLITTITAGVTVGIWMSIWFASIAGGPAKFASLSMLVVAGWLVYRTLVTVLFARREGVRASDRIRFWLLLIAIVCCFWVSMLLLNEQVRAL